ncbi:MAG: restriction endonuclease, partial [Clostridiaceae bacterium]|nr:restriction endonuclease [Clostridiaceae bacterium]
MTSKEFITEVVQKDFPDIEAEKIIEQSYLIQYLIYKMRSVGKSSKARGSYGSIYPIYTLVEDYVNKGFDKNGKYKDYEGAIFTEIFSRQRELPFGEKLQNHGFNNRVNDDFRKYFARYNINDVPIIRNLETQRYWINENLLILDIDGQKINIAKSIMNITEKYIELKIGKFNTFFKNCNYFKNNYLSKEKEAIDFIRKQLNPDVDARIFEIVSFCIL